MSSTNPIALLTLLFAGSATAPRPPAQRHSLRQSADATLDEMIARDPPLDDLLHRATAYAVFPSIGAGGGLVGGACGRGILYEGGAPIGHVSLEQASIGAQLGGRSFAELLVLRTLDEVRALKRGHFTAGANLGLVVLTAGAAAHPSLDPNASVFVLPHGRLMVDISISGQQLNYQSFNE